MPTYDYQCTSCKHVFEVFQNINDKPINKCPKCGKKVKRLIGSGAGIIFKGSGFYATDYRKQAKGGPGTCPKAHDGCKGCSNG